MIGSYYLVSAINTLIDSGVTSNLEKIQLSGAVESIEKHGVSSVKSAYDLPPAGANKGRFFYIEVEKRYVLSDGITWSINPIKQPQAFAWGDNFRGALGDNTKTNKSSPALVVGGFTDWVQISAGGYHTAAIRANGTAWAWGRDSIGQLGDSDPTLVDKTSPVSVVGGFTDWVQIDSSRFQTMAVRANGTAWGWGDNARGQLGVGDTVNRSSPALVVGGFTDWVQVSAGTSHGIGVRANGTSWGWGYNVFGQVGDGTTTISRVSPVLVVGGFTDWVQASVGLWHTAAIRANGTAWAWGLNSNGRLGDNSTSNRNSPVSVVGGFTDWVQISAGFYHTSAIKANGTAWAWGLNTSAQLGDTTATSRLSPVSVVGGFTDWVQIDSGSIHTTAIRANGTAWAWGSNAQGRLGDFTPTTSRNSPVSVVGGFTDWVQISAGSAHTAAIRA